MFRTLKSMYLKKENERESCVVAYLLGLNKIALLFLPLPLKTSLLLSFLSSRLNVCECVLFVYAMLGGGCIYRQFWCKKT